MSINAILSTKIKENKNVSLSAQELFEEYGFTLEKKERLLVYTKMHKSMSHVITFDLDKATFSAAEVKGDTSIPYAVRSKLLKAIVTQEKELGWM